MKLDAEKLVNQAANLLSNFELVAIFIPEKGLLGKVKTFLQFVSDRIDTQDERDAVVRFLRLLPVMQSTGDGTSPIVGLPDSMVGCEDCAVAVQALCDGDCCGDDCHA